MTALDSRDLDERYALPHDAVSRFAGDGFVRLAGVLSPATLAYYGDAIDAEVARRNTLVKPMHERTTYERAILQVMNLWTGSDRVRRSCFSGRLARIAAALLATKLPMAEASFALGEISVHTGWTFHRAGANATDQPRDDDHRHRRRHARRRAHQPPPARRPRHLVSGARGGGPGSVAFEPDDSARDVAAT